VKKILSRLSILLITAVFAVGCQNANKEKKVANAGDKPRIIATTTMLADLTKTIGGEYVEVQGLMGAGVDPHLYKASAGDVKLMQNSNMVVYSGLHLEGKMEEIFENLINSKKIVVRATSKINEQDLIKPQNGSTYDPHVWFDVKLWKSAAEEVTEGLKELDGEHSKEFEKNLEGYLKELDELNDYILKRVEELPKESRVLVTAHDAFNYFGKAYGFEVKGLQGISTASEAGTADVRELADFIVQRRIKAIFIESSVPKKNIEALQEAVKAKGFEVKIGGELYSDSLGDEEHKTETYIKTVKSNIDTIVNALK